MKVTVNFDGGATEFLATNDGESLAPDIEKNVKINKMATLAVDIVPPIPQNAGTEATCIIPWQEW